MTKEELKNKYSAFITEISEILGLGKPVDILKLCATTDLFFKPLEKRIEELEKENAELKEKLNFSTQYYQGEKAKEQLTKAKEIILRLYNAGRDVLMCRAEEKAYDNLSNAINDKSIEQFLKEIKEK